MSTADDEDDLNAPVFQKERNLDLSPWFANTLTSPVCINLATAKRWTIFLLKGRSILEGEAYEMATIPLGIVIRCPGVSPHHHLVRLYHS